MKDTGIELTCVAEEAIGRKLPLVPLEDLLNEQIQLSDYGTGIEKLFFVYIVVSPNNTIHEPHIIYTESESNLEIALKLDYQKSLEVKEDELKELVQQLFITGLKLCEQTKVVEFDWKQFIVEVKETFNS